MPRLPIPGSDNGTWGDILNEFLLVAHDTDGTPKTVAVTSGGTGATSATDARTNLGAAAASDLSAHITDTTTAHAASAIGFTPTGSIASTDVQAAIAEVANEATSTFSRLDTYFGQTAQFSVSGIATPFNIQITNYDSDDTAAYLLLDTDPDHVSNGNSSTAAGIEFYNTLGGMPTLGMFASGSNVSLSENGVSITGPSVTVPSEAYGSGWDGSSQIPTKRDLYDKIESLGTYSTYTPTFTQGVTLSTSSLEARYTQIGKIVWAWCDVAFSSSGTSGQQITFTLPVTAHSNISNVTLGTFAHNRPATALNTGVVLSSNTTTARMIEANTTSGAYYGASPSFQVVSGQQMRWSIQYEAA